MQPDSFFIAVEPVQAFREPVAHVAVKALIPLGYFQKFDLYAAYQYPNQATVYAVAPDCTVTVRHLHHHNPGPPTVNRGAIEKAIRRCRFVNVFFGSQWAYPAPLGRACLPVRRPRPNADFCSIAGRI